MNLCRENYYREMILLVEFYTRDLIFLKENVTIRMEERQQELKLNFEDWFAADSCSRLSFLFFFVYFWTSDFRGNRIDFNLRLFVRHARLWKDHVFSREIPHTELQRQMFMFLTMYAMIDESKWNQTNKCCQYFV